MQRKFLEGLGIEKEAIDKIMDANGRDLEKVKEDRDTYKQQLDDAQKALKGFEGVDISQLQGEVKN